MQTTFIDRRTSKERILSRANTIANPNDLPETGLKLLSEYKSDRQGKLLVHVIRAEDEDTIKQTTFAQREGLTAFFEGKRRVRRPQT